MIAAMPHGSDYYEYGQKDIEDIPGEHILPSIISDAEYIPPTSIDENGKITEIEGSELKKRFYSYLLHDLCNPVVQKGENIADAKKRELETIITEIRESFNETDPELSELLDFANLQLKTINDTEGLGIGCFPNSLNNVYTHPKNDSGPIETFSDDENQYAQYQVADENLEKLPSSTGTIGSNSYTFGIQAPNKKYSADFEKHDFRKVKDPLDNYLFGAEDMPYEEDSGIALGRKIQERMIHLGERQKQYLNDHPKLAEKKEAIQQAINNEDDRIDKIAQALISEVVDNVSGAEEVNDHQEESVSSQIPYAHHTNETELSPKGEEMEALFNQYIAQHNSTVKDPQYKLYPEIVAIENRGNKVFWHTSSPRLDSLKTQQKQIDEKIVLESSKNKGRVTPPIGKNAESIRANQARFEQYGLELSSDLTTLHNNGNNKYIISENTNNQSWHLFPNDKNTIFSNQYTNTFHFYKAGFNIVQQAPGKKEHVISVRFAPERLNQQISLEKNHNPNIGNINQSIIPGGGYSTIVSPGFTGTVSSKSGDRILATPEQSVTHKGMTIAGGVGSVSGG